MQEWIARRGTPVLLEQRAPDEALALLRAERLDLALLTAAAGPAARHGRARADRRARAGRAPRREPRVRCALATRATCWSPSPTPARPSTTVRRSRSCTAIPTCRTSSRRGSGRSSPGSSRRAHPPGRGRRAAPQPGGAAARRTGRRAARSAAPDPGDARHARDPGPRTARRTRVAPQGLIRSARVHGPAGAGPRRHQAARSRRSTAGSCRATCSSCGSRAAHGPARARVRAGRVGEVGRCSPQWRRGAQAPAVRVGLARRRRRRPGPVLELRRSPRCGRSCPGFGGAVLAALPNAGPGAGRGRAAAADQRAGGAARAGRARARRLPRAQDELVHASVAFLLRHRRGRCRSRSPRRADPPLPLARLRAAGELVEIRAEELRFDDAEAEALLNGSLALGLEATDVRAAAGADRGLARRAAARRAVAARAAATAPRSSARSPATTARSATTCTR